MDEGFQNTNRQNEIYVGFNNPNPNYIPPQMTNEGHFNSQNNNIYSVQSNNTPQINNYSQNSGGIYYQNNININIQPQNNNLYNAKFNENYNPPPPIYSSKVNINYNQGYTPYTNEINQDYTPNTVDPNPTYSPYITSDYSDNNNGFTSQANDDNALSTKVNNTPVNVDNNSLPNNSEPLVLPPKKTNKENNVENCCSRRDPSMREVTGCQKCLIIGFCIFLDILGFNEIALASLVDSIYYSLALSINILNIAFTIMESVSILRIRWIRIFGSVLSIIYLLGTIIVYIIQFIKMENNEEPEDNERIDNCKLINFMKIIVLIIIMNIVFYAYWGIRICYRHRHSHRTRSRRRRHP